VGDDAHVANCVQHAAEGGNGSQNGTPRGKCGCLMENGNGALDGGGALGEAGGGGVVVNAGGGGVVVNAGGAVVVNVNAGGGVVANVMNADGVSVYVSACVNYAFCATSGGSEGVALERLRGGD